MRAHRAAAGFLVAVLLSAVPVPAQVPPVAPLPQVPGLPGLPGPTTLDPSDPALWLGQYRGTLYTVREGVVERFDGSPVTPDVAARVLEARRVFDVVAGHPGLGSHLRACGGATPPAAALADVQSRAMNLLARAHTLTSTGSVERAGLDRFIADLHGLEVQASRARFLLGLALDACRGLAPFADSLRKTHGVEEAERLVRETQTALPSYEAAAHEVDRALESAEAAARSLDPIAATPAAGAPVHTLHQLRDDLRDATEDLERGRDDLRRDTDALRQLLPPARSSALPLHWLGAGAFAIGGVAVGAARWLRRRG